MGPFARAARQIARISDTMGEPRFPFVIEVPSTVTRPGHSFNVKKSTVIERTDFGMVRGGWKQQREENPEGMGRADERVGEVVLFHWKHGKTHGEIRQLISAAGAVLKFDGVSCVPTQILNDTLQDATVVELRRQGSLPNSQDADMEVTQTLGLLAKVSV